MNDNRPEFACNPYMVTIAENAPTQQQVIQLQATDLDLYSKPLKYFFGPSMSDPASIFGIDSETGWITVLTPLDRETQDQYNLTVIVSDTPGGGVGRKPGEGVSLTSTTSVLITISDSNDNPPKYERDAYTTAVNEGALPGTVLVTLVSKDADSGINAEVTYYITEGDQLGQFDVSSISFSLYILRNNLLFELLCHAIINNYFEILNLFIKTKYFFSKLKEIMIEAVDQLSLSDYRNSL